MAASASVIVRARDEVATIGITLAALRRQSLPLQVIVVDSGSTDGTVEVARQWADRVLQLPQEQFSYGRALNIGAADATARFHVSLSAHCLPPHDRWVEAALRHFSRPDVAAVGGNRCSPDGKPISPVYLQTLEDVGRYPYWGLSNHGSCWRAELWETHPFDPELEACEDKVWSWELLRAGWRIAFDPLVWVEASHRRDSGCRQLYGRVRREARALAEHGDLAPFGGGEALRTWWDAVPPGEAPRWVRRWRPYRAAEVAGRWRGEMEGRERRRRSGGGARLVEVDGM